MLLLLKQTAESRMTRNSCLDQTGSLQKDHQAYVRLGTDV